MQVLIWDRVYSGLCPFGRVHIWGGVHSRSCPFSMVPFDMVSIRDGVRSGLCFSASYTGSLQTMPSNVSGESPKIVISATSTHF